MGAMNVYSAPTAADPAIMDGCASAAWQSRLRLCCTDVEQIVRPRAAARRSARRKTPRNPPKLPADPHAVTGALQQRPPRAKLVTLPDPVIAPNPKPHRAAPRMIAMTGHCTTAAEWLPRRLPARDGFRGRAPSAAGDSTAAAVGRCGSAGSGASVALSAAAGGSKPAVVRLFKAAIQRSPSDFRAGRPVSVVVVVVVVLGRNPRRAPRLEFCRATRRHGTRSRVRVVDQVRSGSSRCWLALATLAAAASLKSGAAVEHENASSIIDWLAQPRPSATSEDELADVRGRRDSCAREPVPSGV